MNRAVKKLWLKALRSGEYKQNHGENMRNTDGYDAFGVLCDIHRKTQHRAGWKLAYDIYSYMQHEYDLPLAVLKWAGLQGSTNHTDQEVQEDMSVVPIMYKGEKTSLMDIIDNESLTFKQLAQLIERKL